MIENTTYDELQVGTAAVLKRTLTFEDIQLFAAVSGDVNPAHLDHEYAQASPFKEIIAHGMFGGALISNVLGTKLPGPGTIYLGQSLKFKRPVHVGDDLTVTVTVLALNPKNRVTLDCRCTNQNGETVIEGEAEVIAPAQKIRRQEPELPEVVLEDHTKRYRQLLAAVSGMPALRMAIAHPCSIDALLGVIEAARMKLIAPLVFAPKGKLLEVADQAKASLDGIEIIDVPHSHAAAFEAVRAVREGRADALMKGSLHTDELLGEVVNKATGLRTARRLSHVFAMDVPRYPKPLLITDAAINIAPDLEDKADIIRNAIDLAHATGVANPKVAILSAVETITGKMQSTLDAAALCKMADRGQIAGAILDGPLAFDNAVSMAAAKIKGISSPVAGDADILVVPDIESGNMLAKQLEYLADAEAAGIVLGARVPIVLTSRADSAHTRVASCMLAMLLHAAQQRRIA